MENFALGLGSWTSQGPALLEAQLSADVDLDVELLGDTTAAVKLDAAASIERDFGIELLDMDLTAGADVQLTLDLCHNALVSAQGVLDLEVNLGQGWKPFASLEAGLSLALGVAGCTQGWTESIALPAGTSTLKVRLSALDEVWITWVKTSFCTAPKPELAECEDKAMDVCVAVDVSGSICSPSGVLDLCLGGSCSDQGLDATVACNNFHLEKTFIAGLIGKLSLYGDGSSKRFSVVSYADTAVSLGDANSPLVDASAAVDLILGLEYTGGYSNAGGAIQACLDTFADSGSDREKSIILVSAGLPTVGALDVAASLDVAHSDYLRTQADAAFDMGVELFPVSVGIDLANIELLAEVATDPSHLVKVNAFLDLLGGLGLLMDKFACSPSSFEQDIQTSSHLPSCHLQIRSEFLDEGLDGFLLSGPASLLANLGLRQRSLAQHLYELSRSLLGGLVGSVKDTVTDSVIDPIVDAESGDLPLDANLDVDATLGFVLLGLGGVIEKDLTSELNLGVGFGDKAEDVQVSVSFCYKSEKAQNMAELQVDTGLEALGWKPLLSLQAGVNLATTNETLCVTESIVFTLPILASSLKLRVVGMMESTQSSELLVGSIQVDFCLGKPLSSLLKKERGP